jgi:hypothetical protein
MVSALPLSEESLLLPLFTLRDIAIKNGQEGDFELSQNLLDLAYVYLHKTQ